MNARRYPLSTDRSLTNENELSAMMQPFLVFRELHPCDPVVAPEEAQQGEDCVSAVEHVSHVQFQSPYRAGRDPVAATPRQRGLGGPLARLDRKQLPVTHIPTTTVQSCHCAKHTLHFRMCFPCFSTFKIPKVAKTQKPHKTLKMHIWIFKSTTG